MQESHLHEDILNKPAAASSKMGECDRSLLTTMASKIITVFALLITGAYHRAGKFTKLLVNSGPVTKWLIDTGLLNRPCNVMEDFLLWPSNRCLG